jgi:iron complex outermembrane receptor protein
MRLCSFLLSLGAVAVPASARQGQQPDADRDVARDLKRLSIEELAQLDVTSVSRRVERLAQTAAAVSVVRLEDIRRTGSVNLPEALRLADGVDVARSDGRTWNITARGFNIVTTNKLLVLMDGRTLYSPLFSGTFWDVQDPVLADLDRIEVIRGPGGSVWGANAVNGVINVISKSAAATRGTHVLVASGTENQLVTSARYGARAAGDGSYRVFAKYRKQGANVFANGESAGDALQLGQFGFRVDSSEQRPLQWTLQANAYRGTEGLLDRDDTDVHGGYAQGRLTRRISGTSEFRLATYYDYTYRNVPLQFRESRHTVEVDAQHRIVLRNRHDVIYGGQVRVTTSTDTGATFSFEPEQRTNDVSGVFVQDEVAIKPGILFLTLGSKFERNDYTGLEVQPTTRLRWSPSDRQTVWGAVSRAVRLPTRFDTDLRIPARPPVPEIRGSDDFEAESVIAYETGYRLRPHPRASLDVAWFVNDYDKLRSQELPSRLGFVIELGNTLNAVTTGVEAAGTVQLLERWRVHGSYTYLHGEFTRDPESRDVSGGVSEANDPPFHFSVRSYFDLPHGLALDWAFRHVAARPSPAVPAYSSLDLRFGWAARPGWELSLVGQNLLDDSHPELGSAGPRRLEFQRGVYVRSIWQF